MSSNCGRRILKAALTCLLTYAMVWSGIPVPALAQMAQAAESDDVEVEAVAEETPTEQEVLVTQGESEPEEAEPEGGQTIESVFQTVVVSNADDLPDNDELFAGYVQQLIDQSLGKTERLSVQSADESLNESELIIYNKLKDMVEQAAAGQIATTTISMPVDQLGVPTGPWTSSELGLPAIIGDDGNITKAAKNAAFGKLLENTDVHKVIHALLAECPYDLYWFEKTDGCSYGLNSISYTSSTVTITGDFIVDMYVAEEYSVNNIPETTSIQTPIGASVTTALSTAASIVEEQNGKPILERLTAYKDAICDRVEYDKNAANNPASADNNSWQLIWVFDGKNDTNVVCEGYSKAFKYLCDLTWPRNPSDTTPPAIECLLVTGEMVKVGGDDKPEGHMWNVVRMDDNKNYLVDVTNCDTGKIGAPDKLFLAAQPSGAWNGTYTFSVGSSSVAYSYDDDTKSIFTEDDLAISSEEYVKPVLTAVNAPTAAQGLTYNGTEQTGVPVGTGYTLSGVCTATDASTYTATATLANGYKWSDDTLDAKTIEWSIAPKSVTVTADNQSKTYGDADPSLTATASGTLGTDTVSYTVSRTPGEDVGEYAITPTGANEQGNYTVTYVPGRLTITKRTISSQNTAVTFSPTSYMYTGTNQSPEPTVVCNSKSLTQGNDFTCSYTSNRDVGTASVTVSGTGNYDGSVTGTFQITKAPLTIAANNTTVAYGDEVNTAYEGVTYSGFLGSDDASSLGGSLALACNREQYSNAGTTQTITPSGLTSHNYDITFANGTLTVDPRPVTLTWTNTSSDYDGESHCPTATAEGLVNGDEAAITVTGAQTNAGTYEATATAISNSNYCLPANPMTSYVINKAGITLSVSLSGWTYGEAPSDPVVQGNTGGGAVSYEYKVKGADDSSYSSDKPTDANNYVVKATVSESANHQGATATAEFTIARGSSAAVTAPAANELTYTGSAQKLVSEGTVTGGTMEYSTNQSTWSKEVPTATDAGSYSVWYKIVGDNNHENTDASGPIEVAIAQADNGLAIQGPQSVVKGSTLNVAQLVSGAHGGVVYEITQSLDGCSITDQGLFTAGNTSGTCVITVSAAGDTNHNSARATLSIQVRSSIEDAVVTLGATSYTYDGTTKTPGVTSVKIGEMSLVPNQDYEVEEPAGRTAVGSYTYTIKGLGEYIGTQNATFRIEACSIGQLSVTAPAAQTYTGVALTPRPTVRQGGATLREGTDYALSYANNVNAGTATVTVTGRGNFAGSRAVTFRIAPAAITSLSLAATSFTYDGSAKVPAVTVRAGGLVVPAGGYAVAYANNVDAGTATVTVTGRGNFAGSRSATFFIAKAPASGFEATGGEAEVLWSKAKKKAQGAGPLVEVSGAVGGVSIQKVGGSANLEVDGSGRVTVRKKSKKGTYRATVLVSAPGDANHEGASREVTVTVRVVAKLTNTLDVAPRSATLKRGKSAAAKKYVAVKGAKGKVTYKKAGGPKQITVASNGKLTVKKGCRPGTYNVKVKVTAAGNGTYKKATKTVTCTVVVL